jgi:integrase
MALGRSCTRCKSTFGLSTTACPRCKLPLEVFRVRLQRPDGRWFTRQTTSLAEAQALETAALLRPSAPPPSSCLTLGKLWEKYEPFVSARNRSASDDETRWRLHIGPWGESKRLDELKTADVYALLDSMVGKTPASKQRVFALLRRMINWSIEVELYSGVNPCSRVKLPHIDNTRTDVLDDSELKRLVGLLEVEPNRRLALIVLGLLWTGKRRGELRSLTWENVFMSNALVRLEASNTKAKKLQTFPLNSKAMAVFKEAEALKISDYVFPASTGKYYTDLENSWRRWRKRNGFPTLILHSLRRTAITSWARAGLNPQTIQRLSGHATLSMVMRYTVLSAEDVRSASELLCRE